VLLVVMGSTVSLASAHQVGRTLCVNPISTSVSPILA
jgi:hypothetical protein